MHNQMTTTQKEGGAMSKRIIVERDGYSHAYNASVQGELVCRVSCPVATESLAIDLAALMADGYTRRAAGKYMAASGYDVTGLIVFNAERVA